MSGRYREHCHCVLLDPNGQCVPGLFHRMTATEESSFRSYLGAKLSQWGVEVLLNGFSCGWMVEVA